MKTLMKSAATVALIALLAPAVAHADPACDAAFEKVSRDVRNSLIPSDGETGLMSDRNALMKVARSAHALCRGGA